MDIARLRSAALDNGTRWDYCGNVARYNDGSVDRLDLAVSKMGQNTDRQTTAAQDQKVWM